MRTEQALQTTQPPPMQLSVEMARDLLARSKDVDEVRDIADRAKAVALYLRSKDAAVEAQNDAAEIRLRAERRLGELVAELPKQTGGHAARFRSSNGHDAKVPPTLKEQGIDKRDAARWQQIARIPEAKFEQIVAEAKAKGERLTSTLSINLARTEGALDRLKNADPALASAVRSGRVPLKAATLAAGLPSWRQRDIALDPSRADALVSPGDAHPEVVVRRFAEAAERCVALAAELESLRVIPPTLSRQLKEAARAIAKHMTNRSNR